MELQDFIEKWHDRVPRWQRSEFIKDAVSVWNNGGQDGANNLIVALRTMDVPEPALQRLRGIAVLMNAALEERGESERGTGSVLRDSG